MKEGTHMRAVVLGSGPGGYVCAIRLAQLGAEVTVVEKGALGGTCLNVGCIPTKALLHTAEVFTSTKKAADYGVVVSEPTLDWGKAQQFKQGIVEKLVSGVAGLLKANGVDVVLGEGRFARAGEIEVSGESETKTLAFDAAVVATGASPRRIPIPGAELPGVLTSTEALALETVPKRLVIIGGGVIGCEMADIFAPLGCEVSIIEALLDILNGFDDDIVAAYKKTLKTRRIKLTTGARVASIEKSGELLTVGYTDDNGGAHQIECENVLIAAGRAPNLEGIGLETLGLELKNGAIDVDKATFETAARGVYAIGDVIDSPQLAHTASAEGVAAAEAIMGEKPSEPIRFDIVPSCVYTALELAGVGLTQRQCDEQGLDYAVGSFPVSANGKSMIAGARLGTVKLIADNKTKKLLGAHLACPGATEVIGQLALALRMGASIDDIDTTIHAHPTVYESIHEAALGVFGAAIHLPPKP